MKKVLMVLLVLVSSIQAQAKIVEAKRINEILGYINSGTLVVFDLDNTVMEPVQMLGSDQWFDSLVKLFDGNIERAVDVWQNVQRKTEMKTVEPGTPDLIRGLRSRGLHVLALTARP